MNSVPPIMVKFRLSEKDTKFEYGLSNFKVRDTKFEKIGQKSTCSKEIIVHICELR